MHTSHTTISESGSGDKHEDNLRDATEQTPLLASAPVSSSLVSAQLLPTSPITYLAFFTLGLAALLPWNAISNMLPYYQQRFKGSPFAESFSSYLVFSYTATCLPCMLLATLLQHRYSMVRWCQAALVAGVLGMAWLGILLLLPELDASLLFYHTAAATVLVAVVVSVLQIATMAIASRYQPIYIQAYMTGQSVAGLGVAVFQLLQVLLVQLVPSNNIIDSTDAVMSSGQAVLLYFTSAFIFLVGLVTIKRYLPRRTEPSTMTGSVENPAHESEKPDWSRMWQRVRLLIIAVWWIFTVTIAVYPSITSKVAGSGRTLTADVYIAGHFVVYNFGDWLGRMLPVYWQPIYLRLDRHLLLAAIARLLFLPLFLLSNVQDARRAYPPWFTSDIGYYALVLLFAITNGWLYTLVMMRGPHQACKPDQSLAGSILAFTVSAGLTAGAAMSFLMQAALCQCNPFIG